MLFDRVFVYGTLRRGGINHYRLSGADFLGSHQTRSNFSLLHLGRYPGAVEGGSTAIGGEIYRIDRPLLLQLDKLEGYPALFTRKPIDTPQGKAWIYLYRGSRYNRPIIYSGDWWSADQRPGAFTRY